MQTAKYTSVKAYHNLLVIDGKCPACGKSWTVHVPKIQFRAWQHGAMIQQAMPNIHPKDRELLLNGFCCL